jgi:hypothetical protein
MMEPSEYHELVGKLIKDARQRALIGLWCDTLERLPALRILASAERKTVFAGGAMTATPQFEQAILRDLFEQVDAACRGALATGPDEPTLEATLVQNLRETANVAREGIIARTREHLASIVDERHRAAVRELLTEISTEFDERRN